MVECRIQNIPSWKCIDGNQARVLESAQGVTRKSMVVADSAVMT